MKKLLTFFLTFMLLVVSAVSMVGCSTDNIDGGDNIPSNSVGNVLNSNVMSISLFSSPVTQSENYVAKMVTAVITPAEVSNKAVDWSVLWITNNEGENAVVTDYVTVTPTSDGSLTAEVRCYKAFEGSTIGVKVVTRVGKISAMCNVTYIGEPSSFEIVQNDVTVTYDEMWGKDIIDLDVGQSYLFDLTLNNIFNNVTENFVPNYVMSVECFGEVNAKHKDSQKVERFSFRTMTFRESPPIFGGSSVFDSDGYYVCLNTNNEEDIWNSFLGVGFKDGKLKIYSYVSFTNFMETVGPEQTDTYIYDSCVDNKVPYAEITITETNTNLSQKVAVRTRSAIESVSVDGNLTF